MAEDLRREPGLHHAIDNTVVQAGRTPGLEPLKAVTDLVRKQAYALPEGADIRDALLELAAVDLLLRGGRRWTRGRPVGSIDVVPDLVEPIERALLDGRRAEDILREAPLAEAETAPLISLAGDRASFATPVPGVSLLLRLQESIDGDLTVLHHGAKIVFRNSEEPTA